MTDYRSKSLWWNTLPEELATSSRYALHSDIDVDVAIVGAGYTGLWTAYYLQQRDPNLNIAIIDSEVAGYGASGRNGGWCSAYFPTEIDKLGRIHGRESARTMQDAMHDTVTEIENVVKSEGIDCEWQRGGTISFARTPLQWQRAQDYIHHWEEWGYGAEHYALLSAGEAKERAQATNLFGATYTPHVAAINPAKLVRLLANIVEKRGATIYEHTAASKIEPGKVTTDGGVVNARYIVRATEGYTKSLEGQKRNIVPIYSLMMATEPLSPAIWDQIGLAQRETFGDFRNLIIYGQRTADDRFAFGGRGAPYHFGSSIKDDYDQHSKVHPSLLGVLAELFPVVAGAKVTHTWGGPLGVARDWMASAGLDRKTGIAWAGGYVGDGVGTTNLSGRTLADLITNQDSSLTKLPWVNHKSPNWEVEPLRWIGANAGLQIMSRADHAEDRTDKPSKLAGVVSKLLGQ
jgi:glycine/D-amino acid oxidase-like deaminating enzyme